VTDDPLDCFVHAYQREHAHAELDAVAIKRRLTRTLSRKRGRRATLARWLLPIAAAFAGSVALAAVPGVRAGFDQLFRGPALAPGTKVTPRVITPRRAAPPQLDEPEAKLEHLTPSVQAALLPIEPQPARVRKPKPEAAAATPEPPPAQVPAPPNELSLYRKAHALHFGGAAPSEALAAWDDYLSASPTAVFASDARYNRALCLLRLGRRAEARMVLQRFAQGDYGEARRTSAVNLLQALGD
jgi:hypothetical protein